VKPKVVHCIPSSTVECIAIISTNSLESLPHRRVKNFLKLFGDAL
jgi:hypothetical protein